MKHTQLFEEFVNESQKQDAALQKVEALPAGKIFDDAKRIDGVFKMSKRPWNEVIAQWERYQDAAKPGTINPKDVQITQPNIQLNKVKEMIFRDGNTKTINVILYPEGPVIWDGHHRLTKAWALGETHLRVNLLKV